MPRCDNCGFWFREVIVGRFWNDPRADDISDEIDKDGNLKEMHYQVCSMDCNAELKEKFLSGFKGIPMNVADQMTREQLESLAKNRNIIITIPIEDMEKSVIDRLIAEIAGESR